MRWEFYTKPRAAWDAMDEACRKAKTSIRVEQFIIEQDSAGIPFLELLAAKAREGVSVRLLVDMAGSFGLYNSARAEELRRAGVEIHFFNPIKFWRVHHVTSWFFRDHRKMLVVDSEIAFTGSLGYKEKFSDWRETMVRIEGAVAKDMGRRFDEFWECLKEKRRWLPKRENIQEELQFVYEIPYLRRRFLYYRLLRAVKNSKKYIYLTTPYFVPNGRFLRALRRAARRGVDVRLMLAGKSDFKSLDFAARSFFGRALRSGIKIYPYQKSFIHAKIAIIDDALGFVGSMNFDNLSFFFNHEGDLVSSNREFVSGLWDQFLEDMRDCGEIVLEKWKHRPLLDKFFELCTEPFHWWM